MNFANGAVRRQPCEQMPDVPALPSREQLETVALALARREREIEELAAHIDRQLASLAELRGLLLQTLWPRRDIPST